MPLLPRPLVAFALSAALTLAACTGSGPRRPKPPPSFDPEGFYLATSFEAPVCGNYHHPDTGCEFGIQGQVLTGSFDCRTGPNCLQAQRGGSTHMGAIRNVSVEGGHAFVGAAFRVPALPAAQKPFIELMQLSPGDGSQPLNPIEVRIDTTTRALSLSEFQGPGTTPTAWTAPVDEWFYVVVEMSYGTDVINRMFVFGPDDQPVAKVEVALSTAGGRGSANPRQKIGGVTNTLGDITTYADDWYISTQNLGPIHIGADGTPTPG